MKYCIEYSDGIHRSIASDRKELLKQLKKLKREEISDIRKLFKDGMSETVLERYERYIS
ncbi:hypothetical protein AALB47_11545 [Lachnospiraceae bacterium 54-11]